MVYQTVTTSGDDGGGMEDKESKALYEIIAVSGGHCLVS
jgi:hypothetical protein